MIDVARWVDRMTLAPDMKIVERYLKDVFVLSKRENAVNKISSIKHDCIKGKSDFQSHKILHCIPNQFPAPTNAALFIKLGPRKYDATAYALTPWLYSLVHLRELFSLYQAFPAAFVACNGRLLNPRCKPLPPRPPLEA